MANQIIGKLSTGTEVITGTDLDDYISPLGGSDFIDGKKGFDTVFVFWPSSKFKLTTLQGITYLDAVSGASRSDKLVLKNVEAIEFSDKVVSLEIADRYVNTPSKDNFDGGPGIDTVVYDKPISNYVVVPGVNGIEVNSADYSEGSDWLLSIERLQFKDRGLAFDVDGHAGVAAKTLGLVFGQEAVSVPKYMGICLDYLDNKQLTATQLMHEALAVRLGADAQNTEKLVSFLYERLTGTVPIQSEKDKYVGWITSGAYTGDSLAVYASGLSLNPVVTQLTGMATTGIAFEMPT
ncbi:MAG: hypothetical protein EBQ58_15775 [Betaproteobacteria bacterium]|nr:hypothetical protein [Betaproteobacteria bacterium]